MEKIKVLVVEDEVIIADNICDSLVELGYLITEPAINYTEAITIIDNDKPDIAIIDIRLSGKKSGLDLAKKINEKYKFPFIILTSNSDKYTIEEAKEVMPAAFLAKPFSQKDLYTNIEIAISNFNKFSFKPKNEIDFIFIKTPKGGKKIKLKDIIYIQSLHVYIEIVVKSNEKFLLRKSMSQILESLSSSNFIRSHRSFIVNIDYIDSIGASNYIMVYFIDIKGDDGNCSADDDDDDERLT